MEKHISHGFLKHIKLQLCKYQVIQAAVYLGELRVLSVLHNVCSVLKNNRIEKKKNPIFTENNRQNKRSVRTTVWPGRRFAAHKTFGNFLGRTPPSERASGRPTSPETFFKRRSRSETAREAASERHNNDNYPY